MSSLADRTSSAAETGTADCASKLGCLNRVHCCTVLSFFFMVLVAPKLIKANKLHNDNVLCCFKLKGTHRQHPPCCDCHFQHAQVRGWIIREITEITQHHIVGIIT